MARKTLVAASMTGLLLGSTSAPAQASGPPDPVVLDSIAKGVEWLATQQEPDGYWPGFEACAVTGLAIKKLMHHAVDPKWGLDLPSPFDDANPYKSQIENGLAWLLHNCTEVQPIVPQPAGDPDSDGDGLGVAFRDLLMGAGMNHSNYTTGIALMALCEAVELDRVVASGPLAGWTYEDVARDAMDWLAYGQIDVGSQYQGGWGYQANDQGWGDNSNAGYVTLGLGFAEAPRRPAVDSRCRHSSRVSSTSGSAISKTQSMAMQMTAAPDTR